MEERVVTDLAILPDETSICPVCKQQLTVSFAPYRYLVSGATRTSYAGLLYCKKCHEFFGNNNRLERIRISIMSGKRKGDPEIIFPSHPIDDTTQKPSDNNALSKYDVREKSAPTQHKKAKKRSIIPSRYNELKYTVELPEAEIVYSQIESAPPTTQGPIVHQGLTNTQLFEDRPAQSTGIAPSEPQNTPPKQNSPISKALNAGFVPPPKLSSFSEIVRYKKAPSSTVLVIQYQSPDDRNSSFLFVVSNPDDHDGTQSFYHVSSEVGNRVIESVLRGKTSYTLNDISYTILRKYTGPSFQEIAKPRTQIIRLIERPKELVDVYVYNLHGLCRLHGRKTEKLIVNMVSSRSQDPHPLEVYYCPVCGKFYVNYETYFNFYRRYGIPPLRLFGDSGVGERGEAFSSLRNQSDLNLFGYNVSGELAENPRLRQAILEDIIDSGNLTKAQVTSHLEWLIRFGKHNAKMQNARDRWRSDLKHIEAYQPRRTNIWGQFKSADLKVFL